ncbi:Regulator of nonsense transcripts 1 [Mycena venus]|uniref:Regulator of nonsense transcripts 1 n=1 Tax=Mycena venus TaxID=2733690 RepID=A0A8H6X8S2_9AGAR|nr:Regulator of nonsense transcripts 1 [Mycena venus]
MYSQIRPSPSCRIFSRLTTPRFLLLPAMNLPSAVSLFVNSSIPQRTVQSASHPRTADAVSSAPSPSPPSERVLLVYFNRKPQQKGLRYKTGREHLRDLVLCAESYTKYAFKMDGVATSLYLDFGFRIVRAVDLLSAVQEFRESVAALLSVLGGEDAVNRSNLGTVFLDEEVSSPRSHVALQAWAAWRVATLESMRQRVGAVPMIDTRPFSETRLRVLSKLARDVRCLAELKPTRVENEVDSERFSCKKGQLNVTSTRFQTRVLANKNQRIEVESTVGDKMSKFSGKAVLVEGRSAYIALNSAMSLGAATGTETIRVTTVGREGPNRAETQRADIVRRVLQASCTLLAQPFFQALWLAGAGDEPWPKWKDVPRPEHQMDLYFPHARLNVSQRAAVRAILSNKNEERVTLVQGPPGTGKLFLRSFPFPEDGILSSAYDTERTVWVIAQSNVAVKNIAEKLADVELDFTLLIFTMIGESPALPLRMFLTLVRRHEHLYQKIMDNVLRSDDMDDDFEQMEQRMLHSRVVLCTLSMLSNPRLSAITRLVPLQTLMVDEASQVEIGDFVPMLYRFSRSLQKMVFIGDDRQLPPHGADKIWSLQSVFEIPHLRKEAIFLDTQYRMPTQLGSFIGKHVYGDKLKTVHHNSAQCCWFVDVKGTEVAKGRSWINVAEARAAIDEARVYYDKGKSYRIITPYDAQRALLESTLKAAKIPWENKVFCVDSFQGNEDDYIILSVVRTEKIGFLAEMRRVNVMLTRARRGMVICASREFVEGAARGSLVGLLAAELGDGAWD